MATPIGNMRDLSARAADELSAADLVCCEDTRRAGRLFELAGIERRAPFMRVDDHTESARVSEVLERLERGERVVVVTDAGTPGISDPGERLVRAATAAGYRVEVVPGPSAAIAALVGSGLPTGRFVFEGFLPRKGAARAARLDELARETRTIVFYEAPHRLAATLTDLVEALGGTRPAFVARELTKLHEELRGGTLEELREWSSTTEPRGEIVLVVGGAPPQPVASDEAIAAALVEARGEGLSARDAAARVASELGVPRRRAYELATG